MNGFVIVTSVPPKDPAVRRNWPRVSRDDIARIDRVLAGAPTGYRYPTPRLSRPLPADGSAPKGWTRISDDMAAAA